MDKSILDLVGTTSLISLKNIHAYTKRILLKMESFNPAGSVKDRSAKYIIEEAEKRGLLKPGGTIIESSSGNFGIALAMIGAAKGYNIKILVDPKTTESNKALLKGYGAEVIVVTEKDDCGSYHKTRIALANKMASEIDNSFRPDQCFSLLNSEAHYEQTAKELLEQCDDNIGAIVVAVSTGGQIGGISKYFKENRPDIKIIGVDAIGSIIFGGEAKSYLTPGVGLGWTPVNMNIDLVDEGYLIEDELAFIAARVLAKHEGIMVGPSSGAAFLTSMHIADILPKDKIVISMVADRGDRYVDTLFNEKWLGEFGFSIDTNINFLIDKAKRLKPKHTNANKSFSYNNEIEKELSIPKSTKDINEEIMKQNKVRFGE
ncbi:cysteine synthase family protein [Tissierella praeacuta]|uniref:cysteine synthase family protein n=1 Tax=Tissierella praeacuta TaxID=43131 RepID=UPI00289D4A12|nr:cysteine synthase family protein [Tissierella praeacuta]